MKATARATLSHPIESVFSYVADITRMPLWVTNFSGPRWIPCGDRSKNSTFMGKYNFNGRTYEIAIEVVSLLPPNELVLRSRTVPFAFEARVEMTAVGNKTEVEYTLRAGSGNAVVNLFILLFGRVAGRMLRRQLESELELLAELLLGEFQQREQAEAAALG